MSAPTTLITASAFTSAPSSNTQYGKGSFLVGFFGEAIKYSLDGQIWYEHPKHYDWAKGDFIQYNNSTANVNDKTVTLGDTPMFIHSMFLHITTTSTLGNRWYGLKIENNIINYYLNRLVMPATNSIVITFGTDTDTPPTYQYNTYKYASKFWNDNLPYWNKLVVKDEDNVDSNDDIIWHLNGVNALPNYHWIEFKNCKNFQVEKVVESLSDGVFTSGSTKPHSLKILKI